jgi:hypothetical protein
MDPYFPLGNLLHILSDMYNATGGQWESSWDSSIGVDGKGSP